MSSGRRLSQHTLSGLPLANNTQHATSNPASLCMLNDGGKVYTGSWQPARWHGDSRRPVLRQLTLSDTFDGCVHKAFLASVVVDVRHRASVSYAPPATVS